MRRKIVIEVEGETSVIEKIVKNIEAEVIGQVAANELDSFGMHKEILPERISGEIKIPEFLRRDKFVSQQEKGMVEALHGKGVMQNG